MQSALEAADAAGIRRDASDAARRRVFIAAQSSLFKPDEREALGRLLDMATLEAHEVARDRVLGISTGTYRFERRLRLKPRSGLVGDMLDLGRIRCRDTVEGIAGRSFAKDPSVPSSMTMGDVQLRLGDWEEWLLPAELIAALAASVVFSPLAAFCVYKRCRARLSRGVTLVLSGSIHVDADAPTSTPVIGFPFGMACESVPVMQ